MASGRVWLLWLLVPYDPQGTPAKSNEPIRVSENNLQHLADSVEELFAAATTFEVSPSSHVSNDKCSFLGGVKRLQRLIPSKKIYASLKALVDLSKSLRSAADVQLLDCLNFLYQGHSPLVQPVLGAVAVAGRKNAQKAAFQFLEQKDEEHLRRQYFIMLAHNLWPSKIASEVLVRQEVSTRD